MMRPVSILHPQHIWHRLCWIAVFAAVMGIVEAIACIYLRHLPPVGVELPPRDYQVQALPRWRAPTAIGLPPVSGGKVSAEFIREASTVAMLVAVAWLAGLHLRSRLACFFFAFGVWDIFFYVGLKWLAGWPHALLEWDCLFVIPKHWFGPVLAPVLISIWFVVGCCVLHMRGLAARFSTAAIGLHLLAFAFWYWSFVKDSDLVKAGTFGGVTYSWSLFAAGLLSAIAGLWLDISPRDQNATSANKRDATP